MHLLATFEVGTSVLIMCPGSCTKGNKKVEELEAFGAGVWGNGLYTDHSFVCHAALHQLGVEQGLFVLTIKDAKVGWRKLSTACPVFC